MQNNNEKTNNAPIGKISNRTPLMITKVISTCTSSKPTLKLSNQYVQPFEARSITNRYPWFNLSSLIFNDTFNTIFALNVPEIEHVDG